MANKMKYYSNCQKCFMFDVKMKQTITSYLDTSEPNYTSLLLLLC